MEHLVEHRHPARRLQDVVVHVVALQRDERQAVGETPLAGIGVFVGVERSDAVSRQIARETLPASVGPGDLPGRRFDDERRAPVRGHVLATVHPELVVGADVSRNEAIGRGAAFRRANLQIGGFFCRQHRLVGQRIGTFHRREGGIGPDALQIGCAPGRARRGVRRLLSRGGDRQTGDKQRASQHVRCGEAGYSHEMSPVTVRVGSGPGTAVPAGDQRVSTKRCTRLPSSVSPT